jgi:hypothetical protein
LCNKVGAIDHLITISSNLAFRLIKHLRTLELVAIKNLSVRHRLNNSGLELTVIVVVKAFVSEVVEQD